MLFSTPSIVHKTELLALRLVTYWRTVRSYLSRQKSYLRASCVIALLIVAIRFRPKTSALAKAILGISHPVLSRVIHVALNAIPDITFALLAIAGLSYLIPDFTKRIEKSKPLRIAAIIVFGCFTLLAIIVNAVNREEQEHRQEISDKKVEGVGQSVDRMLNAFIGSKREKINEAERRRQVLEALRDQYVIKHPEVPVTMITGNTWPPKEWMDQRLAELGEPYQFISPEVSPVGHNTQQSSPPPPAIDLTVVVSNNNEDVPHVAYGYKPGMVFIDHERSCLKDFKCYPERDFTTQPFKPIDIKIGDKGWARVFFAVYNVGGSTAPHPTVSINVARGRDVFVDHVNQRQAKHDEHAISQVDFTPRDTFDLIPYSKAQQSSEFSVDVSVGPLSDNFSLMFRIFSDNLKAHIVLIPFHIVRI